MLNDFNGADRVFLATGFTDLRRGIDGLASELTGWHLLYSNSLSWPPFPIPCFFSVADIGTGSRRCTGKATDLCCVISGLSPVLSNGHGLKQKPRP